VPLKNSFLVTVVVFRPLQHVNNGNGLFNSFNSNELIFATEFLGAKISEFK